jgi:hypothetical protein
VGVLCNDFGELGLAMYFLQGQPFADRTTLLLPPRLADRDDGRLPVATRRFSSAQDILRVVDEEEPDAVVLLSGYLLTITASCAARGSGLVKQLRPAAGPAIRSSACLDGDLADTFDIDLPSSGLRATHQFVRVAS